MHLVFSKSFPKGANWQLFAIIWSVITIAMGCGAAWLADAAFSDEQAFSMVPYVAIAVIVLLAYRWLVTFQWLHALLMSVGVMAVWSAFYIDGIRENPIFVHVVYAGGIMIVVRFFSEGPKMPMISMSDKPLPPELQITSKNPSDSSGGKKKRREKKRPP